VPSDAAPGIPPTARSDRWAQPSIALLVASSCSSDNKSTTPSSTTASIAPARPPPLHRRRRSRSSRSLRRAERPAAAAPRLRPGERLSLAVADINAGGGVLGAPVKATSTDDQVAGSVANAVTNLVDGGANAVLGPISSTDAKAAIRRSPGAGALACSASATSADLNSNPPTAASTGRRSPDYETSLRRQADRRAARCSRPGQPWKVVIVARGDDTGSR